MKNQKIEKLIQEIQEDIKKQNAIYNSESSTTEEQIKAYKKKIDLQEELYQLKKGM